MSHFTVLVFGENIEKQLQPFYEFECTGNDDEKWDWYQVGGRWTGFFKLKENATGDVGTPGLMTEKAASGYADSVLKRDIDFESMRSKAGMKAGKHWDAVRTVVDPHLDSFTTWTKMRDEIHPGNIETATRAYRDQPAVRAMNTATDKNVRWADIEDFLVSKDQYIQKAIDAAITTFAVIKDGKWYERGKMGWWGCVSDEKDKDSWNAEFSKLLDETPDDIRLTVVDCHI